MRENDALAPWLEAVREYLERKGVKLNYFVLQNIAQILKENGVDSKTIAEVLDNVDFEKEDVLERIKELLMQSRYEYSVDEQYLMLLSEYHKMLDELRENSDDNLKKVVFEIYKELEEMRKRYPSLRRLPAPVPPLRARTEEDVRIELRAPSGPVVAPPPPKPVRRVRRVRREREEDEEDEEEEEGRPRRRVVLRRALAAKALRALNSGPAVEWEKLLCAVPQRGASAALCAAPRITQSGPQVEWEKIFATQRPREREDWEEMVAATRAMLAAALQHARRSDSLGDRFLRALGVYIYW